MITHVTSDVANSSIDSTRRNLVASLAGLGIAAPFIAGRRSSVDEPITLRYTSHAPRSHGLYTQAFVPFAELVEHETEGRLQLVPFTDRLLHGPIDGFKAAVAGITDYTRYEYFSGTPNDPTWTSEVTEAVPLDGLATYAQGSAMYHWSLERYLFISGLVDTATQAGALYQAPEPWGPWSEVGATSGGYIPSFVANSASEGELRFIKSGGSATHSMNLVKLAFTEL